MTENSKSQEIRAMSRLGLIRIGESFMCLHELIKRHCPPDSAEAQLARVHLGRAYEYLRLAFGEPEIAENRGESDDGFQTAD